MIITMIINRGVERQRVARTNEHRDRQREPAEWMKRRQLEEKGIVWLGSLAISSSRYLKFKVLHHTSRERSLLTTDHLTTHNADDYFKPLRTPSWDNP